MANEDDCKCIRVFGHLEAVKWLLWRNEYKPSQGLLAVADWTHDPHLWLHYVESSEGLIPDDDVLKTTDARYWSIHDVQRYFIMEMHCEQVLFTQQYPNLRMPTRLGSYFWRENTAAKLPPYVTYQKELALSMDVTLKKSEAHREQMDRLLISDQFIKLDQLDVLRRVTFFRILENIFSFQDNLQLVSLENLSCKRLEGVKLIEKLANFNAHTLKYLFLWRFVLPNENPILINYSYITGTGLFIPRYNTRRCFLKSLGMLTKLRVLALEWSHIADSTGSALISLLPILKRPHFRLQLICREGHIPGYIDASLGEGGHDIPDTAWRRISIACPDLYVLMVFSTVSIHQWRFALIPLRRVFEVMPFLTRFFYVGLVEDDVDLRRMLQIIACGVCHKLKQLQIKIQDEDRKRKYWENAVDSMTKEYKDIMDLLGINFCLNIYKS